MPLVFEFSLLIHFKMLWWLLKLKVALLRTFWHLVFESIDLFYVGVPYKKPTWKWAYIWHHAQFNYDVNVTILDVHGCITCTFLRLRSVLAFLYLLNGWPVVNFNQHCLILRVPALAEAYKYFYGTIAMFCVSTC